MSAALLSYLIITDLKVKCWLKTNTNQSIHMAWIAKLSVKLSWVCDVWQFDMQRSIRETVDCKVLNLLNESPTSDIEHVKSFRFEVKSVREWEPSRAEQDGVSVSWLVTSWVESGGSASAELRSSSQWRENTRPSPAPRHVFLRSEGWGRPRQCHQLTSYLSWL